MKNDERPNNFEDIDHNNFVSESYWDQVLAQVADIISPIDIIYIKQTMIIGINHNIGFAENDLNQKLLQIQDFKDDLEELYLQLNKEVRNDLEGKYAEIVINIGLSSADWWINNPEAIITGDVNDPDIAASGHVGLADAAGGVLGVVGGLITTGTNPEATVEDYFINAIYGGIVGGFTTCLLYTSPSPRD